MHNFTYGLILIFFLSQVQLINFATQIQGTTQDRYKMAIDSGVDAAAKYTVYNTEEALEKLGVGFGEGEEDKSNIYIDKDKSLEWFYKLFFKNVGLTDIVRQDELKKYIPMKCIVGYDRMYIADKDDNWVIEKPFEIEYQGNTYLFTLSNQVQYQGSWYTAEELGIDIESKNMLINLFVEEEVENFINGQTKNIYNYDFTIGIDSLARSSQINGISFIVFIEGMPIARFTLNEAQNKLYGFAAGGSEIIRKNK